MPRNGRSALHAGCAPGFAWEASTDECLPCGSGQYCPGSRATKESGALRLPCGANKHTLTDYARSGRECGECAVQRTRSELEVRLTTPYACCSVLCIHRFHDRHCPHRLPTPAHAAGGSHHTPLSDHPIQWQTLATAGALATPSPAPRASSTRATTPGAAQSALAASRRCSPAAPRPQTAKPPR